MDNILVKIGLVTVYSFQLYFDKVMRVFKNVRLTHCFRYFTTLQLSRQYILPLNDSKNFTSGSFFLVKIDSAMHILLSRWAIFFILQAQECILCSKVSKMNKLFAVPETLAVKWNTFVAIRSCLYTFHSTWNISSGH